MSSTGCEKENFGGIDAFHVYFPNVILPNNQENNLFYPKIFSNNPDAEFTAEIMEIFADLNKDGKTIIIATHDKNIVNQMKRRVVTFDKKGVTSDIKNGIYNLKK